MIDPMDIARNVRPVSGYATRGKVAPKKKKDIDIQDVSWDNVPIINPQDLVGKRVFPIFADLTKAGKPYSGIDSSKLKKPEPMMGGPGYPLLPESQKHGLGWAVEGKGRGSSKIRKDADYVIVHAMEQTSHQSNASFANSLMKTMKQYVTDKRVDPQVVQQIDDMIRRPSEQKELQSLKNFPGFSHKNAEKFLRGLSFEARLRVARVLESAEAQKLGAPNIDKITRATLDPQFAGVPSRHGLFVMEIPKGTEDEQLVHLKTAGLPEHPSYQYGIKGRIVGRFNHPVAPEVLYSQWFDQKKAEKKEGKSNIRRAFDLAMPTVTVTQDVADRLPHRPQDIQSGRAAQLALNAFNDQWHDTDTDVNKGGLGAAQFSQALKNSDSSATLSQYSPQEINAMKKDGKFTGYKLKDGEVYFGLKRGTNYADEYGFNHPDLTPNETALVSVVNNEPGAKGIGGAPVVLKAIQHGATALDAYAVPSDKHPKGFLPNFYKHFGFEELGRVPFDPKYVTPQQFDDMKHEWAKTGWDEKRHGLPSLSIMKWRGSDADRSDAVRKFVTQGGEGFGARDGAEDVEAAAKFTQQSLGAAPEGSQRGHSIGDASGNRGAVRADNVPRPSDRFTRTLAAVKGLSPVEAQHFGLNPADIEQAKASGLKTGGTVRRAYKKGGKVEGSIWHERDAFDDGGDVRADSLSRSEQASADRESAAPEMHEDHGFQSDPEGISNPQSEAEKLANQGTIPSWAGTNSGLNEAAVRKQEDLNASAAMAASAKLNAAANAAEGAGIPLTGATTSFGQQPLQAGTFSIQQPSQQIVASMLPKTDFSQMPQMGFNAGAAGTPAGSLAAMQPQHYEPTANTISPATIGVASGTPAASLAAMQPQHYEPMSNQIAPAFGKTDFTQFTPMGFNAPTGPSDASIRAARDAIMQNMGGNAPSTQPLTSSTQPTAPVGNVPMPPIPLRDLQGPNWAEGIAGAFGLSTQQQFDKFNQQYLNQGMSGLDAYNRAINDIQTMRNNAKPGPFDRSGRTQKIQKLMPDGTYQWVDEPYKKGGRVHNSQMVDHVLARFGASLPASNSSLYGSKAGRRR